MIDAHAVQLLTFSLSIYNSLNFYKFLKKKQKQKNNNNNYKHFSIDVSGEIAQQLSKNVAKCLNFCSFKMHV